mgnify:FL=1
MKMKKQFVSIIGLLLTLSIAMTGCGGSPEISGSSSGTQIEEQSPSITQEDETGEDAQENQVPAMAELAVRFGVDGEPFTMRLEDNSTAAAIAGYVGTSDWRLPVYSYDESDVMEYYDVPSRYEIPDNSVLVTQAHAGEVYYSDPNRIVLYYHDAEINEEYTLIGTFDATDEFVSAVENNPVQEGWGNQLVLISDGE